MGVAGGSQNAFSGCIKRIETAITTLYPPASLSSLSSRPLFLAFKMYGTASFGIALLASFVGRAIAAPSVADTVGQLRLAPTANDRLALLKDEDVCTYFRSSMPISPNLLFSACLQLLDCYFWCYYRCWWPHRCSNFFKFPCSHWKWCLNEYVNPRLRVAHQLTLILAIGFLGPCAMNTPHTHPRATEINFSVNGTLRAGMLSENGARFVVHELTPGTAAVFPMGAIHFEMNTGCGKSNSYITTRI